MGMQLKDEIFIAWLEKLQNMINELQIREEVESSTNVSLKSMFYRNEAVKLLNNTAQSFIDFKLCQWYNLYKYGSKKHRLQHAKHHQQQKFAFVCGLQPTTRTFFVFEMIYNFEFSEARHDTDNACFQIQSFRFSN